MLLAIHCDFSGTEMRASGDLNSVFSSSVTPVCLSGIHLSFSSTLLHFKSTNPLSTLQQHQINHNSSTRQQQQACPSKNPPPRPAPNSISKRRTKTRKTSKSQSTNISPSPKAPMPKIPLPRCKTSFSRVLWMG